MDKDNNHYQLMINNKTFHSRKVKLLVHNVPNNKPETKQNNNYNNNKIINNKIIKDFIYLFIKNNFWQIF